MGRDSAQNRAVNSDDEEPHIDPDAVEPSRIGFG